MSQEQGCQCNVCREWREAERERQESYKRALQESMDRRG